MTWLEAAVLASIAALGVVTYLAIARLIDNADKLVPGG